jgi:hypothetical protein
MSLNQIKKIINSGTIYVANTHGSYDLDIEPVPWTVPENTMIFETQTIGDLCLTNIDEPLDELCTHRDVFSDYFFGVDDEGYIAEHSGDTYRAVFRNMVCYLPGNTIYSRNISIHGGRGERHIYKEMGFYKYGKMFDKKSILLNLRTELIEQDGYISNKDFVKVISDKSIIRINDKKITYSDDEKYRIFIISSCAEAHCEQEKKVCRRRFRIIDAQQRTQNLQLMALGIPTGMGGPGYNRNTNNHAVYWDENNTLYNRFINSQNNTKRQKRQKLSVPKTRRVKNSNS